MSRFTKIMFPYGADVAPIPLGFLSVALVTVLQIPAHFFLSSNFLSAGIFINEVVAIAGVPLFLILLLKFNRKLLLPFLRPTVAVLALVIAVTIGADIIIDYLTHASEYFLPLPAWVEETFVKIMAVSGGSEIAWKLFLLCALPAFCEEIFFRGFCQTSLAAKWGVKRSVIGTAIIFALLHGNPWYIHLYFLLGLVFGWLYAVTGTLWAPILCHFLNNAWTFLGRVTGVRFPLTTPVGRTDLLISICGIILFVFSVIFLKKLSKKTA